jgi:hypothetical protein
VRVDGYIPLQVQVAVPIESTDDACADEYVTQNPIFVWAKVEPDLNPPDAGPVDAGTG